MVIALAAGFGTSTWRYFREKEARREADHARANESMLRERAEFREALAQAPDKTKVAGYCFYHWQDVERAVAGDGLHLAFGPTDAKDEETHGVEVGNIVTAALKEAGLQATWNGSFNTRIFLPDFDWKRR